MGEEVDAFNWFEGQQGTRYSGFERIDGSCCRLAHVGFEFGEGIFDLIEVGAVRRQETAADKAELARQSRHA